MDLLRILFSYVCGQHNCWVLGGVTVPFCQRCTGLYVGAFCALFLIALFRPRPRAFLYWLHGILMLVMFPFGFHLVQHGGLVRTFTGALFAFGLVYYLALNPLSVRIGWKDSRRAWVGAYLALIVGTILLLLVSVTWGGAIVAALLALLGALGLAALVFLALANLLVLPGILRVLLHRSPSTP
jgi:uncharacterized membrane protein